MTVQVWVSGVTSNENTIYELLHTGVYFPNGEPKLRPYYHCIWVAWYKPSP